MEFKNLKVIKENGITTVTLSRPKALNALNSEVLEELDILFGELNEDDQTDVVLITGEGKSFVTGADISEMQSLNEEEGKAFGLKGANVFRKIETLNRPVIAVVNGFALGGGCELALSCDIRVASNKAKFGQPETGLGITPGFSGTQRLSRLVGPGYAKELIYTSKIINADEALRMGLVNQVTEPEELMDKAIELAKLIASKGQLAVRYSKKAINEGLDVDMEKAIEIEAKYFGKCFATSDQKEGMDAFLNKRAPQFSKR